MGRKLVAVKHRQRAERKACAEEAKPMSFQLRFDLACDGRLDLSMVGAPTFLDLCGHGDDHRLQRARVDHHSATWDEKRRRCEHDGEVEPAGRSARQTKPSQPVTAKAST